MPDIAELIHASRVKLLLLNFVYEHFAIYERNLMQLSTTQPLHKRNEITHVSYPRTSLSQIYVLNYAILQDAVD